VGPPGAGGPTAGNSALRQGDDRGGVDRDVGVVVRVERGRLGDDLGLALLERRGARRDHGRLPRRRRARRAGDLHRVGAADDDVVLDLRRRPAERDLRRGGAVHGAVQVRVAVERARGAVRRHLQPDPELRRRRRVRDVHLTASGGLAALAVLFEGRVERLDVALRPEDEVLDGERAGQGVAAPAVAGQVQPRRAGPLEGPAGRAVVGAPEVDQTTPLRAFIMKVEERLDGQSAPPRTLEWFPQEGLISARLVPESVLGLRQLKRGFVGKYAQGQAFIVEEASVEAAGETLQKLRGRFEGSSPADVADGAFQANTPYLDSLCIFRKGRYLAGYANVRDPQDAITQAKKLAARIP